jgi:hypothetical protein
VLKGTKTMNLINKLLNKRTTLPQLVKICSPIPAQVKQWREFCRLHKQLDPKSYANGRVNHQWIQTMLADVSNGLIVNGGQGKTRSDCYIDGQKVETKAFRPGNTAFHVAASSFFANNSSVSEWKAKGKTTDDADRFLFEKSYYKNDYYLLTNTAGLSVGFDEIEFILIKTEDLIGCLDPNDKRHCVMEKLKTKITESNT